MMSMFDKYFLPNLKFLRPRLEQFIKSNYLMYFVDYTEKSQKSINLYINKN